LGSSESSIAYRLLHGESSSLFRRGKPKASIAIRALDAVERAGRWKALTVDEFQAIVENLQDIVENMRALSRI
jgi:hypothetical protein